MIFEKIKNLMISDSPFIVKIGYSIAVITLFLLLRFIISKIIDKGTSNHKNRYLWHKISKYFTFLLTIILVGRIWTNGVQTIATYFGLLSAGIAIALRDVITNLVGWLFIVGRQPFEIGDRIQIGEHAGDVIDLRPFDFTILEVGNWVDADQSTGRIISIPNGKIFTQELANFDKGFGYIWNEIPIVITFESDWQKAKEILQNIANKQPENISKKMEKQLKKSSKKFMIHYQKLTPKIYTDVIDFGVKLTIRYLCEPRKRRGSTENIWENILIEFAKNKNINFAYPTTRFYQES
ncbi:MAG: mechanosensitive ion channel [Candidatus Cloacimonetes bacterium]|jgi:small-conductance mechanosensitive channel|nr:mechanosensitive ion channel [Candidatus Cloacimonadota bacterium]MBT6993499.1 mechanosensitive ion channel [Candidatus Cloacimonadota bacterium]MBT7469899.1 mechanosensitive ion channel [Candidatus Cloacimonadota bacterium]